MEKHSLPWPALETETMALSLPRRPDPRGHRAAQHGRRESRTVQPLPRESAAGGAEEGVDASSPYTVLVHGPAAGEGLGVTASLRACGISSSPGQCLPC